MNSTTTQHNSQPNVFEIGYCSNVSEAISVAICVPLSTYDFSTFDTVSQALEQIVIMTKKRLDNAPALVESYGNELTSRINSMKMNVTDEVYDALAPLARSADNLTIEVVNNREGHVPLNKLSIYGARTLINLFVYTYSYTLMEMVKKYDDENALDNMLQNDPAKFWITLDDLLTCCAGYPDFDMTRI